MPVPPPPRLAPAAPCRVCATTGGAMAANTHRPARVSLARHGVAGAACVACYQAVRYRAAHGLDPLQGCGSRRPPPAPTEARP